MIKDRRGLPARRVPLRLAPRRFGWMLYCVRRSGVFVITEKGKPSAVLVGITNPVLPPMIRFAIALALARRRNPDGVFTLADRVFGTEVLANHWMVQPVPGLGGSRPLDLLDSPEGVGEVLDTLGRIEHGIFS